MKAVWKRKSEIFFKRVKKYRVLTFILIFFQREKSVLCYYLHFNCIYIVVQAKTDKIYYIFSRKEWLSVKEMLYFIHL